MRYEYECDKCTKRITSYVEPTYTYAYCVACGQTGCEHRKGKPDVWCFRHGRMTERAREYAA